MKFKSTHFAWAIFTALTMVTSVSPATIKFLRKGVVHSRYYPSTKANIHDARIICDQENSQALVDLQVEDQISNSLKTYKIEMNYKKGYGIRTSPGSLESITLKGPGLECHYKGQEMSVVVPDSDGYDEYVYGFHVDYQSQSSQSRTCTDQTNLSFTDSFKTSTSCVS